MSQESTSTRPNQLPPPQLVETGDDVFAWVRPHGTWSISKSGFVVGNTVTAIDREAGHNEDFSIERAIGEMTAWNGEALPRCLA